LSEPRNSPRAGTKSPVESRCRYSSGNTSPIFGVFRAHGGRIADENRCRSLVSASPARLGGCWWCGDERGWRVMCER
jgi:hypothetical protein